MPFLSPLDFLTSYRCPATSFALDWIHQHPLSSWSTAEEVVPM